MLEEGHSRGYGQSGAKAAGPGGLRKARDESRHSGTSLEAMAPVAMKTFLAKKTIVPLLHTVALWEHQRETSQAGRGESRLPGPPWVCEWEGGERISWPFRVS